MGQFSALIFFLLAVAFLLRIDFIFYIVYVCVGIYAWSYWYTPRALKRLIANRQYNDHAFWGENVSITIRLTNHARLPLPWIQLSESVAVHLAAGITINQVITLSPRETAEFNYVVNARRRGYYRVGPLRLAMGDLFGLVKEQHSELIADYLTIYPRIIPLAQLGLPSRLPFGTIASHQRLFEDPARIFGVRDFRSGDSLRQINWKVSSHIQNLMVKTYEPAISLKTAVLLNLFTSDYRRQNRPVTIEWAIEVAASLAAHLINQKQDVGLITNGIDPLIQSEGEDSDFDEASGRLMISDTIPTMRTPDIPPRHGRAHLMKILERLARIEQGDTINFQQWAYQACLHLSWGVTILTITASGDETTCHILHRLVKAGYNPVLIVIEPDYNFGKVKERARHLGFNAYNITNERDMDQWRQPSKAGVRW